MIPIATPTDARVHHVLSWALIPAFVLCLSTLFLFALRMPVVGYPMLLTALLIAWLFDRRGLTVALAQDLLLIAIGVAIISSMSVKADIGWVNFFLLGFVLASAVAVPYLISRFGFRQHIIRFPWKGLWPWSPLQWGYLLLVLALGWLILPFYFITTGVFRNWPVVTAPDEIGRLFVGVNFVGTWDELFFICTVFVLLKRHFPMWQANLLQAIVFVSFLWELGYQSWGPLLTIPFALLQGYTFTVTRSLSYVLAVHLLFDLTVFLVIVHAANPTMMPFFLL